MRKNGKDGYKAFRSALTCEGLEIDKILLYQYLHLSSTSLLTQSYKKRVWNAKGSPQLSQLSIEKRNGY